MKWIWIDNKQDETNPQFVEFLAEFDVTNIYCRMRLRAYRPCCKGVVRSI